MRKMFYKVIYLRFSADNYSYRLFLFLWVNEEIIG